MFLAIDVLKVIVSFEACKRNLVSKLNPKAPN